MMKMWKACFATTLLSCGLASAAEPEIRTITVPAELAAVTSNPELSGIVWSPSLRRYLLVTDDSGRRDQGTNHEPLLLGLTQEGTLDKTPIFIRGVKAINDPESICAGPDDSYFLATSHSPNREGKTTKERRQLLQLKEDKGALRVLASLDLTHVKGSETLLSLAGLPPDGRLDIEAITYHAGALFVGFKSPLTARGEAAILRLRDPLGAMRAGRLDASGVDRFVAVRLCVEDKNAQICQGISDMTFLSDGSLILSANAPKGGPKDHGGALWHLPAPVGKKLPVLLARFPRLKPEGVTLSPSGRSLMVVFDCDDQPPKWTEVPLPEAAKAKD
jgi:hypothetical protein